MKRTIASLALLRMNWDSYGKDYVEIFVPFIVTLISKKKYKVLTENTLQKDFEAEYGLSIPYYPMVTLLRRTKKRGYIQKKNSEYIPVKDLVEADEFSGNALALERKYNHVLKIFIVFCEKYGVTVDTESADRILISFLKDHDLDIIFANQNVQTLLPNVNTTEQEKFLINKFIQEANTSEPEIFGFIVDISLGHIIANTILYDINLEKFQGKVAANCYLDTGIVLDLLGVNEEARQSASKELIDSLAKNGAKIFIFKHTYDETIGILNGCIEWVNSPSYDPLKASRVARYFKDNNYTPSEVESFILSVEGKLEKLGVKVIDGPNPNDVRLQVYQLDEKALQEQIIQIYKKSNPNFDETEKDFTLYLDVKSISAVNTLRKGQKPLVFSGAKHIFITSNSTLAYASRQFEFNINGNKDQTSYSFYIPNTMTDVFIGTLLWTQSPSNFVDINQKRLIANCYAALQPTKNLLKKFTLAAEKELEKGTITSKEYLLLKESRIARNFLVDETLNDVNLFTEVTIPEILSGIRDAARQEEENKFKKDREIFEIKEQQSASEIHEKDDAIKQLNKRIEDAEKKVTETNKEKANERDRYQIIVASLVSIILVGLFELAVFLVPIEWIVAHPYSGLLQLAIDVIIIITLIAIMVPKWRKAIFAFDVIALVVGTIVQIILAK